MLDIMLGASRWSIAAAMLFSALLLASCSSSRGPDTPAPAQGDAPTGRELFASNCAVCHGAGGEGQPDWHIANQDGTLPPPPLNGDGHTWHHADGLLYRVVSRGGKVFENPSQPSFKSAMPAFGGLLSHEEIVAVLTYVKGLWEGKTKRGLSIVESQSAISEGDPFPSSGE